MTCLHCHADTTNGLTLCEISQRYAAESLDVLPIYFRNLARQQRPGRPNGSLGTSGEWIIRHGDTTDGSAVLAAVGHAANDLTTWGIKLAEHRGLELPHDDTETELVIAMCDLLAANLPTIASTDWAGQFVRDLGRHERILRGVTETAVPGWYAGACSRRLRMETDDDSGRCGAPTYVVPGLTWVNCRACGSTTYARDHLETVLDEARDWTATAPEIARAVVALVDSEMSVPRLYERIKKWGDRGKIKSKQHTTRGYEWDEDLTRPVVVDQLVGPKRYRLGDVLDRLFSEGATRTRTRPRDETAC